MRTILALACALVLVGCDGGETTYTKWKLVARPDALTDVIEVEIDGVQYLIARAPHAISIIPKDAKP